MEPLRPQSDGSAAPAGVSVVICSYNGAARLPRVLEHLARQQAPGEVPWEVIVVDNRSTDDTAATARRCWPAQAPAPLRVVREPRPGLAFAKQRGIEQARYELVGFVDDDSWVAPGWIAAAAEIAAANPQAGAIRGIIEAECEGEPPRWFAAQRDWFGIGPDLTRACDITELAGAMCGDGMVLRKTAWNDLRRKGFEFTQTGNQGAFLSGSEDDELALALRLAGWRLWFDPRLRLRQFLAADKLCWEHLRRRARNAGFSSVGLDPYYAVLRQWRGTPVADRLPAQWLLRAVWSLKELLRRPLTVVLMPFFGLEGRDHVLAAESAWSRVRTLVRWRRAYDLQLQRARRIRWR